MVAGIMGATSGHSSADGRSIYLHIGSAIRGNAFAAHRRVDAANTVRPEEGHWSVRMPDFDDASHWASGGSQRSW